MIALFQHSYELVFKKLQQEGDLNNVELLKKKAARELNKRFVQLVNNINSSNSKTTETQTDIGGLDSKLVLQKQGFKGKF